MRAKLPMPWDAAITRKGQRSGWISQWVPHGSAEDGGGGVR